MMFRRLVYNALMLLCLVLLLMGMHISTHAQSELLCFQESSYCTDGAIRDYWEQNGGLPVFGLPITRQQVQVIEGEEYQVQWFERNRLELHADGVKLGRLGVEALEGQGRDWTAFPKDEPDALEDGCEFFPTGFKVCGRLLDEWHARGGLELVGFPISPQWPEELSDGTWYEVQWFERARFELHTENEPPYDVLLGLLGSEVFCPNVPDPENAGIRPGKCFHHKEVAEFDLFGFNPGERIEVKMLTEDDDQVDRHVIHARDDGSYYRFLYDTGGLYPGLWRVEFRGEGGHLAKAYFRLLEAPSDPEPTISPTPLPCEAPESISATIENRCIAQGGRVSVEVFGFHPGEQVDIEIKAPGGVSLQETNARTDGTITFTYSTTDLPIGQWSIVFVGQTSKHTATVYFEVLSP